MAFKSSKFNMPTYSGSGLPNQQTWVDSLLTKLKDAFIDADSSWSLESSIDTVGTNTNVYYGTRTLQLKSSKSNKYVRIWGFAGIVSAYFSDVATASGSYDNLKIFKGNVFKCNEGNYTNRCLLGEPYCCELMFGVSSKSIDKDFGLNLELSVPLFCINNNYSYMGETKYLTYDGNSGAYYYGGTFTVMTDGNMFSVMRKYNSGGDSDKLNMCLYAPDLISCINTNDLNTEGVISSIASNKSFYLGNNNQYDAENYIRVLFNAADGTHDFSGMGCGIYNGKGPLTCSESCTKLLTTALQIQMWPSTYSGSTMTGVIDHIGMKGWVSTNYIRSTSITQLPAVNKGIKYGSGNWLCVDAGTLVCWNDSNTSPFEAAVENPSSGAGADDDGKDEGGEGRPIGEDGG